MNEPLRAAKLTTLLESLACRVAVAGFIIVTPRLMRSVPLVLGLYAATGLIFAAIWREWWLAPASTAVGMVLRQMAIGWQPLMPGSTWAEGWLFVVGYAIPSLLGAALGRVLFVLNRRSKRRT